MASIELGCDLSTRSYSATARSSDARCCFGVGLALGEREQEIAKVQMGRRRVELGRGGLGVGERQLELAGLVEADRDAQDQRALLIAAGDLRRDPFGLVQIGRARGLVAGWVGSRGSRPAATRPRRRSGLAFRSVLQDGDGGRAIFRLRWSSARV